jgi:hypothetical protein
MKFYTKNCHKPCKNLLIAKSYEPHKFDIFQSKKMGGPYFPFKEISVLQKRFLGP